MNSPVETKYMIFTRRRELERGKTQVWYVRNKTSASLLGKFIWYGSWRQYIFEPSPGTIFNHVCLLEIIKALEILNTEHREATNE